MPKQLDDQIKQFGEIKQTFFDELSNNLACLFTEEKAPIKRSNTVNLENNTSLIPKDEDEVF